MTWEYFLERGWEQFGASLPVWVQMYFFVLCTSFADTLECMLHRLRKLFAFAQGKYVADNPDALINHDNLMPCHMFFMNVKKKIEEELPAINEATTIRGVCDERLDSVGQD